MKKTSENERREADLTKKPINLSFDDNSSFGLLIQQCMCVCVCVCVWRPGVSQPGLGENHSIISLKLCADPVQTNLSCHVNPSYHISAT